MTTPQNPAQAAQSVRIGLDELVSVVVQQVMDFHYHIWQPVAVGYPRQHSGRAVHPRMAPPDLDVTYVLLKCECGEPRSFTLDGNWTMSQIKQEVPIGSTTRSPTSSQERDDQPTGEYPPGQPTQG
jgi:hypothetical protein